MRALSIWEGQRWVVARLRRKSKRNEEALRSKRATNAATLRDEKKSRARERAKPLESPCGYHSPFFLPSSTEVQREKVRAKRDIPPLPPRLRSRLSLATSSELLRPFSTPLSGVAAPRRAPRRRVAEKEWNCISLSLPSSIRARSKTEKKSSPPLAAPARLFAPRASPSLDLSLSSSCTVPPASTALLHAAAGVEIAPLFPRRFQELTFGFILGDALKLQKKKKKKKHSDSFPPSFLSPPPLFPRPPWATTTAPLWVKNSSTRLA